MPQGLIQHALDAKYKREESSRQAIKQAFINYVIGFGNHTCEIVRVCPVCGKVELKTLRVWADENGGAVIRGELPASLTIMKSSFIVANWKCRACGHQEQSRVSFEELRQDFNNPELRK
jgi:hypothetical protein